MWRVCFIPPGPIFMRPTIDWVTGSIHTGAIVTPLMPGAGCHGAFLPFIDMNFDGRSGVLATDPWWWTIFQAPFSRWNTSVLRNEIGIGGMLGAVIVIVASTRHTP